ncbi:substrate-binding domain-containing protein [Streptomyces roseolus]|uniref:substrate-binding domain-containing protein n=1 Tax=Streptomyces roseolus TaxID=67358 RepID=UPI0036FF513F
MRRERATHRELAGLSSMATRPVLAELCEHLRLADGTRMRFASAGGVEIVRRVREGAEADLLVLAADAVTALEEAGHVVPGTARPLWISQVVAAVPADAPTPALDTVDDLRAALTSATAIAYSTGPSGTALLDLLHRLALADVLTDRLIQAPPGVPAGTLLASGRADLAFQQHSELMDLPGVTVLGPLPGDTALTSLFTAAVLATTTDPTRAREALDLLAGEEATQHAAARGLTRA